MHALARQDPYSSFKKAKLSSFQATIKSAASPASRNPMGAPRRSHAEPLSVGSPGIPGGCARSRLDHGLKVKNQNMNGLGPWGAKCMHAY